MMEPVREAFTTSSSPARSAARARMSSAAFPRAAERKPPSAVPTCAESASVARPMRPASGTTARHAAAKTRAGRPGAARRSTTAAGRKTRRASRGESRFRKLTARA
jgi:hypothetical protein